MALNCLTACLPDALCNVMLMLVLTMAASSVTLGVALISRGFTVASKRKEPGLIAASLVTRMLWFLRPDRFPWKEDECGVLRVSEMTNVHLNAGLRGLRYRTKPRQSSNEWVMAVAAALMDLWLT